MNFWKTPIYDEIKIHHITSAHKLHKGADLMPVCGWLLSPKLALNLCATLLYYIPIFSFYKPMFYCMIICTIQTLIYSYYSEINLYIHSLVILSAAKNLTIVLS